MQEETPSIRRNMCAVTHTYLWWIGSLPQKFPLIDDKRESASWINTDILGMVWTSMNAFWALEYRTRSKNTRFWLKKLLTLAITSAFALQSGSFGSFKTNSGGNRTHTRTFTRKQRMFWYRWCNYLFWILRSQNSQKFMHQCRIKSVRGSFLRNFPFFMKSCSR